MRNLLGLLIKYHFTLLFLTIEIIALSLVVKYNSKQKETYINSSNFISGYLSSTFSSFTEYLSLKDANEELSQENARLKNLLKDSYKLNKINLLEVHDSIYFQQYSYIPAKIIRNSVRRQHNHITIDKGYKHGVRPGMGLVSPNGVVGIVKDVSYNFAAVISLLNERLMVSGKLEKTGYYGPVKWDGINYREAKLLDIPFHVKLEKGEKIITSGYSSIFPEGLKIGYVKDYVLGEGEKFYDITITLSTDFNNLLHVNIINNHFKEERLKLEEKFEND